MRVLFFVLIFVFDASGRVFGQEAVISVDNAVIQFESKLGVVTFNHQKHADLSFTECTSCHHTWKQGEVVKPCHACHGPKKDGEIPAAKLAFHARCIGCHEYTVGKGEPAGPQKRMCRLCHTK